MNHYVNNGDGRDFYISYNSGGNTVNYNKLKSNYEKYKTPDSMFRSTLRTYDRIYKYNNGKIDYFQMSQNSMSNKSWLQNKKKLKINKNILDRITK